MRFDARVLTPDSAVAQISIDAPDAQEARHLLEARGLFVTRLSDGRRVRAGAGSTALVLFSQELLALLTAGLSLVEALEALREKETAPAACSRLDALLVGLRAGRRYSDLLADQPQDFPPLYVGIVRAAEGTSDLPRALERYIDYQQRVDTVRSRLASAAIYPAILCAVGAAVSGFLIIYVVPRFAAVYQGSGRQLPWLSQQMLAWGQFAAAHTPAVLAGGLALLGALLLGARHLLREGRALRLLARLPGVGQRVHVYALARLYLTLGMLIEGGIAVLPAMATAQAAAGSALGPRLAQAAETIDAGYPLSLAFERHGLATPVSLRMLRVGERTGELGAMLRRSAAFYDGEISRAIERFTRSFEPLLMAAIGLVVGSIVVLLYMPILDLAGELT